ncbi:hypothetical protein MITS9509_01725 [Synechococcus sp. MIT S9509]|uniref:hypothetical protein n=1 Tax=Synechococcus sp. MIT S9504 TaxID=1801628 RepID=UPI0007BB53D4|nr:hypothetical protein [Synechococcus sp. MIT S9504]KZR87951.1 hypothetical protein MITS9504_00375 [Synechococcus sp. MIT S9504]KZR92264.1 hypothetical protein MITS9509_01725 [Synechococcus sp. MIT S9509]
MSGGIGGGGGDSVFQTVFVSLSWQRLRNQLLRSTATIAGISLLVASGLIGLRSTNRRLLWADDSPASSLAQLSGSLILVQSFRGDPNRAVPSLWTDRLGVQPASDLWKRYGRSIWWQGWSQDGDAYLILSSSTFPVEIQGLQRQRVGSMEVLASDALHLQQLLQRLKTNQVSTTTLQSDSLLGACLQSLSERPGVIWNADALATLSGTLAPLLQQGREGCVQLRLQAGQLLWDGVIGSRPLSSLTQRISVLASGPFEASTNQTATDLKSTNSTSSDLTLLQVDGQRVDLILGTLLSRQIIQAPLEEHYGINGAMRGKIADLPFSMRLQSRPSGAYKAGLQIQLPLTGSREQWTSILEAVSDRLDSRGYQKLQEDQASPEPEAPSLWLRRDDPDQTTVGGWVIIKDQKASVLSIGLGIKPADQSFLAPLVNKRSYSLRITGDPRRLTQLGLLGGLWPKPVQSASTLNIEIKPLNPAAASQSARQSASQPWWRVSGSLKLTPDS